MSFWFRFVVAVIAITSSLGNVPAWAAEPSSRPRASTEAAVKLAEAEDWREDLQALVRALEEHHPDPYDKVGEKVFGEAVLRLRREIPKLAPHEIVAGFARLLALVGDGHTSLPLYFAKGVRFHVLPYRLGVYEDGIYVEAADRRYARLVGGRLLAIGGVPAEKALDRVTPLISRDNDNWITVVAPHLLNRMEVLHALDIADSLDGVELTVRQDGEANRTQFVAPLENLPPSSQADGIPFLAALTDDWVDARDSAEAPVPLYQRRFGDIYWWDYVEQDDLLYIKFDQVANREHGPPALEIFGEALAFAREQMPARTVIDIRNNSGGNGSILPPIIREIIRTREVDEPGKLFLVIGSRTFSAAQMMTSYLEQFSTAIQVGQPSSAVYNGYAGHVRVTLPHSGIQLSISPDYYQMGKFPRDRRQQATPMLAAFRTFEDYRRNHDPALEAILNHKPGRFEQKILAALEERNTAKLRALVRAHDADPVNRYRKSKVLLNALGYRLLRDGREEQALAVFSLNVELHPDYANGWDSLGEAYAKTEQKEKAIKAFRKALEINPHQSSARHWLDRLGAGEK